MDLRFLTGILGSYGRNSQMYKVKNKKMYEDFLKKPIAEDAFRYAKSFLESWIKLLPKDNSKYIFNHLAIFRPVLNKGEIIKFDLITHI